MKLFCGIDWAETHHDVAILNEDGELVSMGAYSVTGCAPMPGRRCGSMPA